MSLKKKLLQAVPRATNVGCRTCAWLDTLSREDRRAAFDEWVEDSSRSALHLYALCRDWDDNPLTISQTGFRHHLAHHKAAE